MVVVNYSLILPLYPSTLDKLKPIPAMIDCNCGEALEETSWLQNTVFGAIIPSVVQFT